MQLSYLVAVMYHTPPDRFEYYTNGQLIVHISQSCFEAMVFDKWSIQYYWSKYNYGLSLFYLLEVLVEFVEITFGIGLPRYIVRPVRNLVLLF